MDISTIFVFYGYIYFLFVCMCVFCYTHLYCLVGCFSMIGHSCFVCLTCMCFVFLYLHLFSAVEYVSHRKAF